MKSKRKAKKAKRRAEKRAARAAALSPKAQLLRRIRLEQSQRHSLRAERMQRTRERAELDEWLRLERKKARGEDDS